MKLNAGPLVLAPKLNAGAADLSVDAPKLNELLMVPLVAVAFAPKAELGGDDTPNEGEEAAPNVGATDGVRLLPNEEGFDDAEPKEGGLLGPR